MEVTNRRRPPYKELRMWMVEKDIKSKDFADLLNLTDSQVSQRLNGTGADFKLEEIRTLANEYGEEIIETFFY